MHEELAILPERPVTDDVLVGRQPIYDRNLQVAAHELLFRGGDGPVSIDGSQATAQVAVNAFLDIGLEAIVGSKDAFLNMTRELLLGEEWRAFPPKRTVLEILEDIEPDTEVIESRPSSPLESRFKSWTSSGPCCPLVASQSEF